MATKLRLYDEEAMEIQAIARQVHAKWYDKPDNEENLKLFEKEMLGRLRDAGYEVLMDWNVIPVDIVVTGITKRDSGEFDVERKAAEVKKSRKLGGI